MCLEGKRLSRNRSEDSIKKDPPISEVTAMLERRPLLELELATAVSLEEEHQEEMSQLEDSLEVAR